MRLLLLIILGLMFSSCGKDSSDDESAKVGGFDPDNALHILPETNWFWQLKDEVNTGFDVKVYDVDLFDVSADAITDLKVNDHIVICYFSAGSWENWRDDIEAIDDDSIGSQLDDWEGEKWFDITHDDVTALAKSRLQLASEKGCDGVEPDNVDGYDNESGFDLTRAEQMVFNKYLAAEAHALDLSIGLKNATDLVEDLVEFFDWSLTEQCYEYDECADYSAFIEANKAVFQAEYQGKLDGACSQSGELRFSLGFFDLDLDGEMESC